MTAKIALFITLAGFSVSYLAIWMSALYRTKNENQGMQGPSFTHLATGFITNFFDTLGIGSFATTTAFFKFRKMLPDELYPGTLNVGHTLPTIFQAFIYIAVIEVDPTTLVLLIASSVIGAWFGAGFVAGLSKRALQIGISAALITAAVAMIMNLLQLFPVGGNALHLEGWRLGVGMIGNLLFGAISTLGIGFYAPCMTMVSLLGLNPAAAFPIMMGSSAFLMPVASARFVWSRKYSVPVAVGLAAGGLFGVPLAAFVVKSLPLTPLRILVIVAVLYAAVMMLRSREKDKLS